MNKIKLLVGILFVILVIVLNIYVTIFDNIAILIGSLLFIIFLLKRSKNENVEFLKFKIRYLYNESGWSFLIRFSTAFLILYGLFVIFIGIAMPGGLIESDFLYQHLNFIKTYTDFIINSVVFILQIIGIESNRNGLVNLRTSFGGVNVIYGCLALGMHSIWIAFVLATKHKKSIKYLWLIIGTISLYVLNVLRICMILLAQKNKHSLSILGIDHHTIYDLSCYLILILLGYIYYKPLLKAKSQH